MGLSGGERASRHSATNSTTGARVRYSHSMLCYVPKRMLCDVRRLRRGYALSGTEIAYDRRAKQNRELINSVVPRGKEGLVCP
eukprot:709794-Rhodomonas_salina.1